MSDIVRRIQDLITPTTERPLLIREIITLKRELNSSVNLLIAELLSNPFKDELTRRCNENIDSPHQIAEWANGILEQSGMTAVSNGKTVSFDSSENRLKAYTSSVSKAWN